MTNRHTTLPAAEFPSVPEIDGPEIEIAGTEARFPGVRLFISFAPDMNGGEHIDRLDEDCAERVRRAIDRGDFERVFIVEVRAVETEKGREGRAHLGGCIYETCSDFIDAQRGGYLNDLICGAVGEIADQMRQEADLLVKEATALDAAYA